MVFSGIAFYSQGPRVPTATRLRYPFGYPPLFIIILSYLICPVREENLTGGSVYPHGEEIYVNRECLLSLLDCFILSVLNRVLSVALIR